MKSAPKTEQFFEELKSLTGLPYLMAYQIEFNFESPLFITLMTDDDNRFVRKEELRKVIIKSDFGYLSWLESVDVELPEEDKHRWYEIEKSRIDALPDYYSDSSGHCLIWDNRDGEIKPYLGVFMCDWDFDIFSVGYVVNESKPIVVDNWKNKV